MDFLDPKLRKAHSQRLFIGYVLMAIAVSLGTLVLLFAAYGYDVDRKTGEVIQNGTIYLETEPSGAKVTVDDVTQDSDTSTRLALPGGKSYQIGLSKDGYRSWKRTLSLDGGSIERLNYVWLLPKDIKTKEVQLYSQNPVITSQSPDLKKLLVLQVGQNYAFDLYNLEKTDEAPSVISVPDSVLSAPKQAGSLSIVEWTKDSKHILVRRDYESKKEFILLDLQDASKSLNITSIYDNNAGQVTLVNNKSQSVYSLSSTNGQLRKINLESGASTIMVESNVLSYADYGEDTFVYTTSVGAESGKVNFRIAREAGISYLLKSLPISELYLHQINEYDNDEYVAIGTNKSSAVYIFKNPYDTLKDGKVNDLLNLAVLRGQNTRSIEFSLKDKRNISVQSDRGVVVYDIEGDRQFSFMPPTGTSLSWVGDYRFSYVYENSFYVVDFDGSYDNKIVVVGVSTRGYFSPNYKKLITLSPSVSVSGRTALTVSDLTK